MEKVFLCILDGFGLGDESSPHNAVFRSKIPNIKRFLNSYPYSMLDTSGESVGLPNGQMGNSEVGHMTIGSGRVLMQDLPLISKSIESSEMWKKDEVLEILSTLKKTGGALHLLGLCSYGGVHSHLSHIHSIANFFSESGIKVFVHAVSDGRDVSPHNFLENIKNFEDGFKKNVKIASLCGRFFAMDRDKKLERTKKAVDLILKGEGINYKNVKDAVTTSYNSGITDEFIEPCAFDYNGAANNDILLLANFRADRARQIMTEILKTNRFNKVFSLMHCSDEISLKAKPFFKKQNLTNTLSEVISKAGMHQFKIAETEKYAHITFFFNGGKEESLLLEDRYITPSQNVKTYDLKPEMSLPAIEEKLLEVISKEKYQFIAANIANGDMVGHTGNFEAAKKAAEAIDAFLGKMEEQCLKHGYAMIITADHGNLEQMLDENGIINTQHTTLPVPFFLISKNLHPQLKNGTLANIAATILKILNLEIPKEMSPALF